jgi:hypothetical protein
MTNLNNLVASVNRFSIGDASLSSFCGAYGGAQMVGFYSAKTNIIRASFVDNYNALDFNTAIQYQRQLVANNGAQPCLFGLGLSNAIYADSVGIGRGGSTGSYPIRFVNVFSNSIAPVASAYFRGTSGGSMSLLAIAVDSGTAAAPADNNGTADFRGGVVDMLVDQIWVAQNRTNSSGRKLAGALNFDWGTINANDVILGRMKYTNSTVPIIGTLLVATNGTLNVISNLVLGVTPADVTGFEAYAAGVSGQVTINRGGAIRANRIKVGQFSTNNTVTINSGGLLDVTNTIADSTKMLTSLTSSGGGLTLHVNGGNTLVYVSNLTASVSSPINIASYAGLTGFPTTIHSTNLHLISYTTAVTPNLWAGGTGPAGVIVSVANNSGNNTIDVTLNAGAAKSLVWKDYSGNHQWDNSSTNWLDVATGLHTNFSTLDSVTFDDSGFAAVNVTENVVPAQSGTGVLVTNNILSYTFSGAGQILGASALVKNGSQSLTFDLYTELAAALNQGSLATTAAGTIASANAATGTSLSNLGNVLGSVTISGTATNAGTIMNGLSVRNGGTFTNGTTGLVNGSVNLGTTSPGAVLENDGTLTVSTVNVSTNATVVNNNTINVTGTMTVSGGGTLIDNVAGAYSYPGSINAGTILTITAGGTFIPGGSVIKTMTVGEYPHFAAQPSGGVLLNTGSTNVFKVDFANTPTSTLLLANNQRFGPNHGNKAFDGCTLLITNIGATQFAAGQSIHLFEYYQGGGNFLTTTPATSTTNTYPVILPPTPGPGLLWDLSDLYFAGNVKIISANDPAYQFTLTNSAVTSPSNIVTTLSWPVDKMGGWVQQLNATLTNGLTATNWISLNGNYNTNVNNMSGTNVWVITNTLVADPNQSGSATFFRFVYP